MAQTQYLYARGLEFEGRHPHNVGIWGITLSRIFFGEGLPGPDDPLHDVELGENVSIPPSPKIPKERLHRIAFYRPIDSIEEFVRYLKMVITPSLSFAAQIFPTFVADHGGMVPMPGPEEQPLSITHAVTVTEVREDVGELVFVNSWGEGWGHRGWGQIPFEYFERYAFECWAPYVNLGFLGRKEKKLGTDHHLVKWTARDEWGRRMHGFEVLSKKGGDRVAWAFVLERENTLEVHELFVMHQWRGLGLGTALAMQLSELFKVKGSEVRLWVPYADCRSESEGTYPAMVAIVRRLGLVFRPAPVRRGAYLATSSRSGEISTEPIEPDWMPSRPQGAFEAVLSLALLAQPKSEATSVIVPPSRKIIVTADAEGAQFDVHSEAWAAMNVRRAELIRTKVRLGEAAMSSAECEELRRLQDLSRKVLAKTYPSPRCDRALIEELKAKALSKSV